MKPVRPRTVTKIILTAAILVGAQHVAPHFSNQLRSEAQSASAAKSQKQKLSNPLNDLLDEAQHDIEKNNFEAAIAPLQKFLAEEPDVAYAHFQLAYAYTGLKHVPEARREYERAIALDPKMSEAYLNLGILLTPHDPADALAPLRKLVELTPAQSRPRILLGIAQERSGDLPGAADSFEGAVHLDPRDTQAARRRRKEIPRYPRSPAGFGPRRSWPGPSPGRPEQIRSRRRLPQIPGP
jgi:Flp pilus assembly protein TadD